MGLPARITTSCSSRRPLGSPPELSSHPARAASTGPNGIYWRAATSATRPDNRKIMIDCSTPESSD